MKSRKNIKYPNFTTAFPSRFSPMLTMALGIGVLLQAPVLLWGDVTISGGTVGGPQTGDGGTFTVTSTGEINSGGEGIVATGTTITALTIDGVVGAFSNGLNVNIGATLPTIGIAGSVGGGFVAVLNSGTVGSLTTVPGGQISAGGGTGIQNWGTFTGTILNGGTINGFGSGLDNRSGGQIAAFTNNGTVGADTAVKNAGNIDTLTNQAGGSLSGGGNGLLVESGGTIGTLTNAGSMSGYNGLVSRGAITTFNNSGTIPGGFQGIGLAEGSFGTFTNSGTVSGGDYAMSTQLGTTIGTLTNSGTFTGYNGIVSSSVTGTIRNLAAGQIIGTGNRGLGQYAALTLLENAGTISGYNAIEAAADIGTIDNKLGGILQGGQRGIWLTDAAKTVGTILNDGTISGSNAIENYGNITTLTNNAAITGTGDWGIYHGSGTIGTLTNAATGTISGAYGIGVYGNAGTIDNAGTIQGNSVDAIRLGSAGTITLLSNSGSMTGVSRGFISEGGTVTTFNNTGSISGGNAIESYGDINAFTNSGTVTGTGTWGFYTQNGGVGTLTNTNTGTITGLSQGVGLINNTVGNIDNQGLIQGTNGHGIYLYDSNVTGITNSGTVIGGSRGIFADNSGSIDFITNSGTIEGVSHAMELRTVGTVTNTATGLIQSTGGGGGIITYGDTTLIANDGLISGGLNGYGIGAYGGTLSAITNTGTIEGRRGIHSELIPFGTITNSGTIQGTDYGMVLADTDTVTNTATGVIRSTAGDSGIYLYGNTNLITNDGLISGTIRGIYQAGGSTTTITNTGRIEGGNFGLRNDASITVLNNSGDIEGADNGIDNRGSINTITNSGTIAGDIGLYHQGSIGTLTNTATGIIGGTTYGIYTGGYDTSMVIDNSGQISGRAGIYGYYGIGDLTNRSGGIISGTNGAGVYMEDASGSITNELGGVISSLNDAGIFVGNYSDARLPILTNAGSIEGATAGVNVTDGLIDKIVNTGVIAYTGAGSGPAVLVGPGGVLGDVTGAGGAALESTGLGALINGRIVNQGTIYQGFTIENQNVEVSAEGASGTFSGGILDVVHGNLTFMDGRIDLASDISVTGGAGDVYNEATLAFSGARTILGDFTQLNVGSLISVFDGPTASTLLIDGTATFDGFFGLELLGLSLSGGETFNLLTFDSYSGGFSGFYVDGVALTADGPGRWTLGTLAFEEEWTATALKMSVSSTFTPVPEPGTTGAAALLVGFGFTIRRRKITPAA